jgi:alpha-mannosidase
MLSYSRDIELQDGRILHIEPFAIALSTSAITQNISKTVVLEVSNGTYILENEFLKATVSSYGALLSLTDKRFESGREVIVQGLAGNNLVIYDDVPFYWDAWDVFEYHKYRGVSINHDGAQQGLTSSRSLRIHCDASLLENEVVFKLTEWGSPESCFQQTIRLASSSAVLEFETAVHWHERHKLLKVEFPLRGNQRYLLIYCILPAADNFIFSSSIDCFL